MYRVYLSVDFNENKQPFHSIKVLKFSSSANHPCNGQLPPIFNKSLAPYSIWQPIEVQET